MRELAPEGIVVGIDEVGRGALAGPLVVACVALPDEPQIVGLDDSKKLSPKRREELATQIDELALGVGIAHVEPEEIDACGMAASLRVAMVRALTACKSDLAVRGNDDDIATVLIDGNPVHIHEGELCVVKGDGKIACIAAASIAAKVARDKLMCAYAQDYPAYGFEGNKGYGSAAHIAALKEHGASSIHRRSFLGNILAEQQSLL
ncbi:MAG: ribonuclease HII [Coriobacteriia bacterium]|nr:MAG: ribonuclease HII [Coriobacteriia bacterium]